MATIGLRVQDSPLGGNLSLADTLAKSIFGDPEGEINARVKASQVGELEARRRKLLADAGLVSAKTLEEQHAETERLNAGPLVGNAAAAAVPMPIPVEVPRPADNTGYGPQLMDRAKYGADQGRYDALVAQEHALGPILVRGNPEQVASGVNKNYGGAIIAGATANPAIVNPDSLRLASTLYTGNAPTTSTVLTSGDYAGVDAAAREDILKERAKPQKPDVKEFGGKPYLINPDGSLLPAQGFQPTPKDPNVVDLPNGGKGVLSRDAQGNPIVTPLQGAGPVPKLVPVTPDTMVQNPDGTLTTPKTDRPAVVAGPFADLNSPEGRALDTISKIQTKLADAPETLNLQDGRNYATAYNRLYEQPKQSFENFPGDPNNPNDPPGMRLVTVYPKPPAGTLTPAEVFARAGVRVPQAAPPGPPGPVAAAPVAAPAPPAAPVAAPGPGAAPPVADTPDAPLQPVTPGQVNVAPDMDRQVTNLIPDGRVTIQRLTTGGARPASQEQLKDRMYAGRMLLSSSYLDKMTKDDIPDALTAQIVDPLNKNILAGWVKAGMPSDVRRFVIARTGFQTGAMRADSGAAIGATEFAQNDAERSPQPGDGPADLADKMEHRHQAMRDMAKSAFAGDPQGLKDFYAEAARRGIDLTEKPTSVPASARSAKPPAPRPAGAPADARQAPDGKWYVPDPDRPGKYLQVQ